MKNVLIATAVALGLVFSVPVMAQSSSANGSFQVAQATTKDAPAKKGTAKKTTKKAPAKKKGAAKKKTP